MQENFGMGKHHQQGFVLSQSKRFALVQLLVASSLPKKLLKLTLQLLSILLVGILPIGQEFAVQLPETAAEGVQDADVVRDAWEQLLVMTKFVNPAERSFNRQPVELGRIVTD